MMGNMGFPVVTRLGINQFWYKYWSTDKRYSLRLSQVKVTNSFIKLFLKYGFYIYTNTLLHEYWFYKSFKRRRVLLHQKHNWQYFRRAFMTDHIAGTKDQFLIRKETLEFFPMRTWIFKYLKWVIVMVKWFVPDKFTNIKYYKKVITKSQSNILHLIDPDHTFSIELFNRIKLYSSFIELNKTKFRYSI
uniref:Ribosomal protein S3a n=1 Tax=Strombidium cf. sulcatum TaxID=2793073 RepID=A0A7T0M4Q5_9SPIT|nr:ribosomal protein S3a [Strombidium cf. sulcatum]QPL15941.1 ribosomal protein S3a [Strombidium cf. sulcatum]